MTVVGSDRFTPFLHEVVMVDQHDNDDAPIGVVKELWPGLMLGEMLVSRAGVVVSGGRNHIIKAVAESSTLYWTYRRRARAYADLSHGWGSNSQWRTAFRRDYRIGGTLFLNVDGEREIATSLDAQGADGLTQDECIELLTHRCFVTTDKAHHDLWPYDARLSMPALTMAAR